MKRFNSTLKNKIIYLIDADGFFGLGLRTQLEEKGFVVFCSNLQGRDLASDIEATKPDILMLGNDQVLSANHKLISMMPTISPASVMILLSSLVNSKACFSLYRKLGLASCVSKKENFSSLYNVIKVVITGYACFPHNASNSNHEMRKAGVSELELTLLKSILKGNDNSEVAKELSLPLKRVSALKIGLMRRLGVNSTAHLVIKAKQLLAF